jgi:hypothetical protein
MKITLRVLAKEMAVSGVVPLIFSIAVVAVEALVSRFPEVSPVALSAAMRPVRHGVLVFLIALGACFALQLFAAVRKNLLGRP